MSELSPGRGRTIEMVQAHGTVTDRGLGTSGLSSHTVYPVKYMVATGNLTTGFDFYGPFATMVAANLWVTANLKVGTSIRVHAIFDVRDQS